MKDKHLNMECDYCTRQAKYMESYLYGGSGKYITKYVCRKHKAPSKGSLRKQGEKLC